MDRSVQRNAASSEETASAASDMSTSADYLKEIVHDMTSLVGGKSIDTGAQENIAAVQQYVFHSESETIKNERHSGLLCQTYR